MDARLYHELTSHDRDTVPFVQRDDPRLVQDLLPNDLATWPWSCKRYAGGLPVTALPREWTPGPPALEVLAGSAGAPALDLAGLARLLHLSAGVVRVAERDDRPAILFRAAGSAGGRFPLELYVAARGVAGLEDGVHWYDPIGHALIRIGPPAASGATTLVVTGIPWRTGWRYAERGYRHLFWDAGTMLAQALALAGPVRLWTRFPDAAVARLVGADIPHELPLALVALEAGEPAVAAGGDAAAGAVDAAPRELPLVTAAFRAGEEDELGAPRPPMAPLAERVATSAGSATASGSATSATSAAPAAASLDDVILRRGSTRRMDAAASVPRASLAFPMAAAMRGIDVPHFVAVHAVGGLEPGLYRWPDLARPLRRGDLRDELLRVCWDQELGHDAAYVVIGAAELGTLDDRSYREAQLAAGLVEGRLHLAAYALGLGASGMTFLDSEIPGLLGAPLAGLLLTCVGVPGYRSRRGGRPGAPTSVVIPQARVTPPEDTDA
jgi:hypothetical protein